MTKETKLRLYNTTSKVVLECSSESSILKQRIRQRLDSAPMKFLGALFVLTTLDEFRNTEIRARLNIKKNVVGKIEEYQSDWARQVERMRSTRVYQQQTLTDRQERSGEPENKVEGPNSSSKTGTGLLAYTCGGPGGRGGGGEEAEDADNR